MRGTVKRLVLLTAAFMLFAVPVIADDGLRGRSIEQGQQEKDECLLLANNCGNEVNSIQQRIDRLQSEIGLGTDVYTNDELKVLNRELENVMKNQDNISMGG